MVTLFWRLGATRYSLLNQDKIGNRIPSVTPSAQVPAAVNPMEGMLEEEVSAETRDSMDKQVIDEAEKMDKE